MHPQNADQCERTGTAATGVRPIRIKVPRTGQQFSFTKVLNAGQEPLTASFSVMRLKAFRAVQMVVQVCAFVLGLIMLWWLSLRPDRRYPAQRFASRGVRRNQFGRRACPRSCRWIARA